MTFQLGFSNFQQDLGEPLTPESKMLFNAGGAGTTQISTVVTFAGTRRATVIIVRDPQGTYDIFRLSVDGSSNNRPDAEEAAFLQGKLTKELKAALVSTGEPLKPEQTEILSRREDQLDRLEQLAMTMVENTQTYNKKLQEESLKVLGEERTKLQQEFESKEKSLAGKEQAFDERVKDYDLRSNRQARRELRKELQEIYNERGRSFSLTSDTIKKRLPTFSAYILIGVVSGAAFVASAWDSIVLLRQGAPTLTTLIYSTIRSALTGAAFFTFVLLFIRWQNRWFEQHAEEEFALKRQQIDLDRASWLVELALEWKNEEGADMPQELLDRLSRNLFTTNQAETHDATEFDRIAGNLLGSASKTTLDINTSGAKLELDRKGVSQLEKKTKTNE